MNTKFTNLNQKLFSNELHLNQVDIWNVFLRYNQICDEKLPSVKIRKNKPKSEISASNYQRYTKVTSRYMFWWMTNTMELVKISLRITKDVKIQDGHQLWLKNIIGIRRAAINPNLEI